MVHLVLAKLRERALEPLHAGAWGNFHGGELQDVVRHSWVQSVGQVPGPGQVEEGHTQLEPERRRVVQVPQESRLGGLGLQRLLQRDAEAELGDERQRELGEQQLELDEQQLELGEQQLELGGEQQRELDDERQADEQHEAVVHDVPVVGG